MLNRKEIIETLKKLNLPKEEYIVVLGASLVVQKVKNKTSDIDIATTKNLFNKLKKESIFVKKFQDKEIYNYKGINFSPNFFDKESSLEIEGIYFQNISSIKTTLEILNKEQAKKDLKKIDLFLAMKDNYCYERNLKEQGIKLICGVDEVGRGPLVGPVVAAAVILPLDFTLEGLTDSKKLSEKKREEFATIIKEKCLSYGIGVVNEKIIDEINIYEATKLAMKEAICNLSLTPEHILIDAMKLDLSIPSTSIIKGDLKSLTISAASVLAKVYRDHLMIELDQKYPYYNFKKNKGYPTKDHLLAIKNYGVLEYHRKSFGPVKEYLNEKKI